MQSSATQPQHSAAETTCDLIRSQMVCKFKASGILEDNQPLACFYMLSSRSSVEI